MIHITIQTGHPWAGYAAVIAGNKPIAAVTKEEVAAALGCFAGGIELVGSEVRLIPSGRVYAKLTSAVGQPPLVRPRPPAPPVVPPRRIPTQAEIALARAELARRAAEPRPVPAPPVRPDPNAPIGPVPDGPRTRKPNPGFPIPPPRVKP